MAWYPYTLRVAWNAPGRGYVPAPDGTRSVGVYTDASATAQVALRQNGQPVDHVRVEGGRATFEADAAICFPDFGDGPFYAATDDPVAVNDATADAAIDRAEAEGRLLTLAVGEATFAPLGITPDGGAQAVGKGELLINANDYLTGNPATAAAELQDAVTDAAAGGTLLIPAGMDVTLQAGVTINKPLRVVAEGATLRSASKFALFTVTADDVCFFRGRLIGRNSGSAGDSTRADIGINVVGTGAAPRRGFRLDDVQLDDFGWMALRLYQAAGIDVRRLRATRYGYAGIAGYGIIGGEIHRPDLYGTRVYPAGEVNTYGITLTSDEAAGNVGSASNPLSRDVHISRPRVQNQRWVALDTHLGQNIRFTDGDVIDCPAVGVQAIYNSTTSTLSPHDITVGGMHISYPVADDADVDRHAGINVRGSVKSDNTGELVEGLIAENTVVRMGRKDSFVTAGIFVGDADAMRVVDNRIIEPASYGIQFAECAGVQASGNYVRDVWKSSQSATAFYIVQARRPIAACDVQLRGNRLRRGSLVAAVVNSSAVSGTVGVTVAESGNDWGGAPVNVNQTHSFPLGQANRMVEGTAAPTAGTWKVGDQVRHTAPVAGGNVGWVCVVAGTPGTWKTFGTIAA